MIGYRTLIFAACLAAMLFFSNLALAACVDDGNNDATTAKVVGLQETVTEVVCPDDKYDYYKLTITDGDDISGSIKVSSTVNGTGFKLSGVNSGEIFEFYTIDASKELTQQVAAGQLQDDTYFLRVTFYSAYATEHPYTITIDLTEEEEETGTTFPLFTDNLRYAVKYLSPWPNKRGFAGNTGRVGFDGPAGLGSLVKSIIMGEIITDPVKDRRYHGLRVGPDNKICYMDSSNEYIFQVPLGDTVGAEKFEGGSESPPGFDNAGNFYFIDPGQQDYASELVSYDSSWESQNWRKNMPAGTERGILIAGERVYTYSEFADAHKLQVWDRDGNKLYDIGFPDKVLSGAEDNANDFFYAQTVDTVYKYDFNGSKVWEVQPFPEHESEYGLEPEVRLGPVVCPEGRLWVRDADTPTWVVLTSSGAKYKESVNIGAYLPPGFGEMTPYTVAVAMGYNGRFYEVIRDSGMGLLSNLRCYDDFDDEVWSVSLQGYGVTDMILDSKNRIYICYEYYDTATQKHSYRWQVRDPADGSAKHSQTIPDIPDGLVLAHSIGAELAIGEDGYLILLHNGGYVAVYSPFNISDLDLTYAVKEESGFVVAPMQKK